MRPYVKAYKYEIEFFPYEGGYLRSILRGGFMNSKVRPYHIHSILNNLLDMGFIETMGRPRKKSE